jgi:hypothetical protein
VLRRGSQNFARDFLRRRANKFEFSLGGTRNMETRGEWPVVRTKAMTASRRYIDFIVEIHRFPSTATKSRHYATK